MFGMGFAEILIIGVIAILFLGPDKLPETMVQIAKFFKSVKTTVASAKSSIEDELHLQEIKEEANSYKRQFVEATNELEKSSGVEEFKSEMREVTQGVYVDADAPIKPAEALEQESPEAEKKPEVVTFSKKTKKPTISKGLGLDDPIASDDEESSTSEKA